MKILLTSDWHSDAVTAGFRRAPDLERAALRTVEEAKRLKVDWWGFLGDLCDPDSGAATIRAIDLSIAIAHALNAASIPNFWIAGNHDVVEDGSGLTTLSPLKTAALALTHVFERPNVIALGHNGEPELHALPFVSRSRPYDPDEAVRNARVQGDGGTVHVFAGHLQLEGAKLGSETRDMPRGRDVAFPTEAVKLYPRRVCLNGHYHLRQRVGEVQIVGSLERLTFGEERNDPGFLVLEV